MKPILYSSTATSFNNQGLGVLSDAVSCTVVEERNGEYELTLQYPVGGIHYSEIEDRAIIMAIPSPYRSAQPFRIYSIESPLNGIVTIHAHHISYDLSGIPVSPFTAGTCKAALSGLVTHSAVTNPFSADTDKLVTGTYTLKVPTSFRACLGGQEGSILDVYGKGEYEFDKFDIYLHLNRGSDNGVKFAYGVNITDFNMERNLESVVTGIYPYWANVDGDELVELDSKIIEIYDPNNPTYLLEAGGAYLTDSNGNYLTTQTPFSFHNVLPLDLSSEFEEAPTQEQLKERAEKYISDNGLGAPKVSIEVSFVHLGQTAEYSYLKEVEKCDLCDTVTVEFPLYGISVKAKIIAIETDVLLERYNSVQIGDPRSTIADTIAGLTLTSATKTEVQMGNQKAADVINNTKGTFEWIDENGDGENEGFTIYESEGVAFLRCTAGGIGLSQDGGLTYTNAITKEGVVATQLNVQEDGNDVFEVYYDENALVSQMKMYHPVSGGQIFRAYGGGTGGRHDGESSFNAGVTVTRPDGVSLASMGGLYLTDQSDTLSSISGTVSVTGGLGLLRTGYKGNARMNGTYYATSDTAEASISVTLDRVENGVTPKQIIKIAADNMSMNQPYIYVYDEARSLICNMVVQDVTINGVRYYMFGAIHV